jgi:hypothetical protein
VSAIDDHRAEASPQTHALTLDDATNPAAGYRTSLVLIVDDRTAAWPDSPLMAETPVELLWHHAAVDVLVEATGAWAGVSGEQAG